MINPGANWVPITDPVELLAFLKELKLTPKPLLNPNRFSMMGSIQRSLCHVKWSAILIKALL